MSENISQLAAALVEAQQKMGNAVKDSKNPFFKSKYADLSAVREAVLPPLNAAGISVIQPTVYLDGKKFVQTMFLHSSGEFISGLTEILSAKELDAQAQGSGISYARRYGLQSLANVGADDDDGQGAVGKPFVAQKEAVASKSILNEGPSAQEIRLGHPFGDDTKKEVAAPARRSFRNNKNEDL